MHFITLYNEHLHFQFQPHFYPNKKVNKASVVRNMDFLFVKCNFRKFKNSNKMRFSMLCKGMGNILILMENYAYYKTLSSHKTLISQFVNGFLKGKYIHRMVQPEISVDFYLNVCFQDSLLREVPRHHARLSDPSRATNL